MVTLHMSNKEGQLLLFILGRVGGRPSGPRGVVDMIRGRLEGIVPWDARQVVGGHVRPIRETIRVEGNWPWPVNGRDAFLPCCGAPRPPVLEEYEPCPYCGAA